MSGTLPFDRRSAGAFFLSAAPGRSSHWFRAGRIRHHRAARRNDSDKDTTNFRIFGPCGGIIRLRAGLRIRRQSSHTGRGCRPEEGRGRAPPGAKALSAVTSGPTGRFARASAGLPSQTAVSDRRSYGGFGPKSEDTGSPGVFLCSFHKG